jgi:O-antigen ligase
MTSAESRPIAAVPATSMATLDRAAFWLLAAALAVTQLKVMPAQTLLGLSAVLWIVLLARGAARWRAPAFFVPLVIYAGLTLVSALFSADRAASLTDCKQLVLFAIVPMTASLARGDRAMRVVDVVIAVGGAAALVGIVQWAMLGYEDLTNRPRGLLSHYMTFSGLLMLVTCAAVARVLFHGRDIVWPAVAVPALLVALAATLTRNAWLGTAAAIVLLFALRNWRLLIVLPVAAAVLLVVAPGQIRSRAASIGDMNDPTTRDRYAMLEIGREIIADDPLTGVGPDQIKKVYAQYRPPYAVNPTNPHLHNVPLQIAAERGLPALAAWLWFIAAATVGVIRQLRQPRDAQRRGGPAGHPRGAFALAATALAAIIAMLTAGLFEYNFGDSEFLMLFLGLITLPFAAAAPSDAREELT